MYRKSAGGKGTTAGTFGCLSERKRRYSHVCGTSGMDQMPDRKREDENRYCPWNSQSGMAGAYGNFKYRTVSDGGWCTKPVFTISEKATVTPASGVVQDFSNGKNVIYTVVSENGTVNEYIVSVAGRQSALKFSFEEWETIAGSFLTNEYVTPQPIDLLATSAPGAAFLKLFQITDLPVFKTDDKKEGEFAIKLVTMDTSAKVSTLVPAITSGSVFTGVFDLDVNDRIGSTKFGIAYDKKPIYFRGWYKHSAPGALVANKSIGCGVTYSLVKKEPAIVSHSSNENFNAD